MNKEEKQILASAVDMMKDALYRVEKVSKADEDDGLDWEKKITFLDENADQSDTVLTHMDNVILNLYWAYVRKGDGVLVDVDDFLGKFSRITITYPDRKILEFTRREKK